MPFRDSRLLAGLLQVVLLALLRLMAGLRPWEEIARVADRQFSLTT